MGLDKAGWINLVKMLSATIIPAVVPGGALIAPLVVHGIEQAQSMEGKTGAEKLQIATQLVDTGIAGINAAKPGAIDAAAVHGAVQEGISTVVDTANIVHAQKQKHHPVG